MPRFDQNSLVDLALQSGLGDMSADDGLVLHDSFGEILFASEAGRRILGLSETQMLERRPQDPRWATVDEHGQPLTDERHPVHVVLRSGAPLHGFILGVHRAGSDAPGRHIWLSVSCAPLFNGDASRPYGALAGFKPVTGRRLQELEVRDSERFYRMIAEHSSDMVAWQLLSDSTYLWASPASIAVLGIHPDALIGLDGNHLVHPQDQVIKQRWRQTLRVGSTSPPLTIRMRHADGEYRWVETTAYVLPAIDGPPTQMITTRRDVTDRVAAERSRDTAIRLFETAVEHATIGMAIRGADGLLKRVNPALCNLLGREAHQLVGRSLGEFAARADPEATRGLDAVASGILQHHEVEREFVRPDGSKVCCIRTLISLPSLQEQDGHVLVQLQDITARKQATAALAQAALTDSLTGLPNRLVLERQLGEALREAKRLNTQVGVLFIDLDGFKQVNDHLGHAVGDSLLQEVARRLTDAVRETDTVVRLGGDEFVVVVETVGDRRDLERLAQRLQEILAEPFDLGDIHAGVAASVGITAGSGGSADDLLREADEAMYRSKRRATSQTGSAARRP